MRVKPIWWILGILIIFSMFYLIKIDPAHNSKEREEQLELPKAPKKNRSIHVSPSKGEDPNSNEERKTIKPLS